MGDEFDTWMEELGVTGFPSSDGEDSAKAKRGGGGGADDASKSRLIGQDERKAKAAPGGGGGRFVPDLEIPAAPTLVLNAGQTVTLKLKIKNWDKLPKGTKVSWGESTRGDAVDIESEHHDGEGTITITGQEAGEGTVRAEVKIGEGAAGRSYRFADTVFVVRSVPVASFVPELEIPSTPRLILAQGETATLKYKIRNWGALPKGTGSEWRVSTKGGALDVDSDGSKSGETAVKVTAKGMGEGTVRAEVRIGSGATRGYRFADTVFMVMDRSQVPNAPDPDRVDDEGGVATVTDLEQDMRTFLVVWKGAATDGVTEFIASALNNRINDLAGASAKSFVMNLLGNLIWCGAAFATGGVAFAISVVGVGVGALGSIPSKVTDTFIPDTQKAMNGQINSVFEQLDRSLRSKASALLKSQPGISRFHALALFVEASFQNNLVAVDATFSTIPKLNAGKMTALYNSLATQALDQAIAADKQRKQEIEDKKTMEYWKIHSRRQPGEV